MKFCHIGIRAKAGFVDNSGLFCQVRQRGEPNTGYYDINTAKYHLFYWPLALTGLLLLLESQIQNGFLARYPDGAANLATFALAASSYRLVNAVLTFVPQTVTLLASCPRSRRMCFRFVLSAGFLLSFLLLFVGFTSPGTRLFSRLMHIPPEILPQVVRYLQWLAPLLVINAVRHYYTGILIRLGRTRMITLLNLNHLLTLVAVLWAGRSLAWSPITTVAAGTIVANLIHLGLASIIVAEKRIPDGENSRSPLRYREILAFFWPVALTSSMFALCRPIMYSYINRTAMAVTVVAALRLAFDAAAFFINPVNQFRHMYTTFGRRDPDGVRRFMFRIAFGYTAVMLLIAFSPAGHFLFHRILGVEGDVLVKAIQALRLLCLAPLTIAVRNLYHGQMMVRLSTRGMAAGAILRVSAIAFFSWCFYHLGWLNHRTGAFMLIGGFMAEALVSRLAVARIRRRQPSRDDVFRGS